MEIWNEKIKNNEGDRENRNQLKNENQLTSTKKRWCFYWVVTCESLILNNNGQIRDYWRAPYQWPWEWGSKGKEKMWNSIGRGEIQNQTK